MQSLRGVVSLARSFKSATPVRLAPGVSVFVRAPHTLQFGLDATRTGIIETPYATELAQLIDGTLEPISLHHLTRSLQSRIRAASGTAESLIADLLSYRIFVPVIDLPVLVLGKSPLAAELKSQLASSGIQVRVPLTPETEPDFVVAADQSAPLVLVDQLPHATQFAQLVKYRTGPTVAVSLFDSRVLIGPLRTSATDPCQACVQQYLRDRDAGWDTAAEHVPQGPRCPDPVLVRAGGAAAAVFIRRVAGVPDPPGVSAPHPVPGEFHVADPFAPVPLAVHQLQRHPDCPVCF